MRRISDDQENISEDHDVVGLVEGLCLSGMGLYIEQHTVEDVQSCVCYVPHGVLERPDDGV